MFQECGVWWFSKLNYHLPQTPELKLHINSVFLTAKIYVLGVVPSIKMDPINQQKTIPCSGEIGLKSQIYQCSTHVHAYLSSWDAPVMDKSVDFAQSNQNTSATGYIIQWWTTLTSHWDGLSQYMYEKLFHFILGIQFFNLLKQGTKLKAQVSRCIQNFLWLWDPCLVEQGWL